MASGVTQPGGAGTTIFVYDDTHANAGGDGAYSLADIKAAMDVLRPGQSDIELLVGGVSGLSFSGTLLQWMLNVTVTFGGQGSDGTLATTWKETVSSDIFQRAGGITYRIGGGPIATRLGTKLGAAPLGLAESTMGGRDGVNFRGAGFTFRNDCYVYGCTFRLSGAFSVQSTGASVQEFAGNLVTATGLNNVLGAGSFLGTWYNNTFVFTTSSNAINGMNIQDARGNKILCVTPSQIIASSQITARIQGVMLSGDPSVSDLRPTGGTYSDWRAIDVIYTDLAPRWTFAQNATADNGAKEYARFNTAVQDGAGNPLIDIPVVMYSSIGSDNGSGSGLVLDTKTFGAGDLGFIDAASGYQNAIRVRDMYGFGGGPANRDRLFYLYVNVAGMSQYPANPAYPEFRLEVFGWPGLHRYQGVFQAYGGTFTQLFMPIMLAWPAAVIPGPKPYWMQDTVQAMVLGAGGQDLVWGSQTLRAIVERRAARTLPGIGSSMVGLMVVALIETGPAIKAGDAVSTDGQSYKVREVRQQYDGALTALYLAED